MWSRLREAVAGIAEQAGIEVPGLDAAAGAVTDLTATAGEAASGVLSAAGASDVVGSVSDLGAGAPAELVTGATDAVASAGAAASGALDEVTTSAGGLLEDLTGHAAP